MEPNFTPPYMTVSQVADYLQCSTRSVHRFKFHGKLKGYKVPGTRLLRFRRNDVERVMKRANP